MSEMNLTELIPMKAREYGADLVGIASAERFASLPAEKSPLSIFPEMKSMIVIGRRVLRGSMRGVEEGTNFSSTYGHFGYQWLEDNFLSQTTYDLNIFIENQGFEAVPLFAYREDGMPKGRKVAPDKPAPNVYVDPDFAAQAAGLGEVGLGGFFISPEYGTRQRFAMLLTDAELEPSPISSKHICEDCGACAQACPFGTIHVENCESVGVPGHEMTVARIDYDICASCPNGAMRGNGRGNRPDRIAAACGRVCLTRLEQAGKCGNSFQNPFRKRSPWALDNYRRPVEVADDGSAAQIGCGKNLDTIGQSR